MRDTFTNGNAGEGQQQRPHFQSKGSMFSIVVVQFDLLWNWKFIPAIHLGPTGDAGHQPVNAFCGAQFDQIRLVEKGWSGADKAHLADGNAVQLW